jgi:23S rRNA (pseudouridine1915-N3)-methyltransferase
VIAVGRARADPTTELWRRYAERLRWPLILKEVEARSGAADIRHREGEAILKAVPKGAKLVALDGSGRQLTSAEFGRRLGDWQDDGISDVAFAIGGADGLDASVTSKADLILSLGRMTWPHLMVRAMLAEQFYRAQTILSGHPYHRE